MNALERNIEYLWRKQDVKGEVYLCMSSFRTTDIHIRIVKGETAGEYFVTCQVPRMRLHGFNLRQLLVMTFVTLKGLTNDIYHRHTINRVLGFFETLKASPSLYDSMDV